MNRSSVEIFNQHNWCKKYTVSRSIHLDRSNKLEMFNDGRKSYFILFIDSLPFLLQE